MNEEPNNEPVAAPIKRKRPLPLRLVRWAVWSFAVFVLLILAVLAFTETGVFKSLLRDTVNTELSDALNAEVRIGEINGNIFTGWRFDSIAVRDDYGPILKTQSLIVRYNPFRVLWQRIIVTELTLIKPQIFITKGPNREWNIDRLFPPSPEDTTASGDFNWTIDVENLRIIDGVLVRYDSTDLGPHPTHRLDMDHLVLDELNVALAAQYSSSSLKCSIFQFRFNNVNGDLDLHNISGDVILKDGGTSVQTFSVATSRSSFQVEVNAPSLDPLAIPDTFDVFAMPFDLNFDSPKFDTRDLIYFLPSLDFLGGQYSLTLDADGTLNDLALTDLDLETEGIHITFTGQIDDIAKGAAMYINVKSDHVLITGDKAPVVLPGIPLPDYSEVGGVRFSKLDFDGEPLKFHTEFDFTSAAGGAAGFADMDITGERLGYETQLRMQSLDLGKIFKSPNLASSLSGSAIVSGVGTSIGSMNTTLDLRLDTSRFQQYRISRLNSYTALGPNLLRTRTQVAGNGGTMEMDGSMTFERDSITNVDLNADASNLNLDSFFPGNESATDLTFTMHMQANGVDVQTASGTVRLDMEPSTYGELKLRKDSVTLSLNQRDPANREILLSSSYADVWMRGEFDIPRFAEYIAIQTESLVADLEELNISSLGDSAAAYVADRVKNSPVRNAAAAVHAETIDSADYMNATYSIDLKEPERLATYFNADMVNVRGTFKGTIVGGPRGFDIGGDIKVSDFYYTDSLRIWKMAGMTCAYGFNNLHPERALEQMDASINLAIKDLGIGKTHLTGLGIDLAYSKERPSFALRGKVDTTMQIGLRGTAAFHDTMYTVTLPQLAVSYNDIMWSNAAPVEFTIDTSEIQVQKLRMRHGDAFLNVSGTRAFSGTNDFFLTLDSLRMGDLEYLINRNPVARNDGSFTGIAVIEANLKGTDANPEFAAGFYVDSLGYRGNAFGKLVSEATYSEGQLELYSEMDYLAGKAGNNVLFISGSVPASISLAGEPIDIQEENANLKMRLQDFPLPLIEQFIGGIDNLEGTANADITVTGTTTDPEFNGFLEINNGEGRLQFNNIRYKFAARIEPEGRRFAIKSVSIANKNADWSEGRMDGGGYIDTKDLGLTGFDLSLHGKLQVLNEESRSNLRFVTGDLYVGTGDGEISLSGRFDKPIFSGELVILRGDITMQTDKQGRNVSEYSNINYFVIDDTTKLKQSSLFGNRLGRVQSKNNDEKAAESAFAANISYDVTLSTGGRFHVVMPFSTLTQEELNAFLDLNSFRVTNWGGSNKFVGEVEVVGDSYYLFWGKRFKASGSLRFRNDLENPDLDLRAVYSGDHTDPSTKERRKVFVIMTIKGTQKDPQITFAMRYDSEEGPPVATGGDIRSDALSFVIFGQFSDELTQGAKGELAGQLSQSGVQLGYSLFSSAFSSLLSDVTPIERFEIQDRGMGRQAVSLTSNIGGFYVTASSQLNTIENSEFSVERQLGDKWFLGISRKATDRTQEAGTTLQSEVVYELKLLYRISF